MFDVLIIGSGIGGLIAANLLAKEGLKVCIVEKNKQIGGNLQTFSKQKQIFDTGVHYIGGLGQGQNLYQIFKYLGLMNALRIEQMDEGFDRIVFDGDDTVYLQSQGYEAFIKNLIKQFPKEEKGIVAYCEKIKDVCSRFPLYHLTMEGDESAKHSVIAESAQGVIEEFTTDKKLQAVFAGNHLLYAGEADKTPFHVHALIVNSYIESSWKLVGGGGQISKFLATQLKKMGGEIIKNSEVAKILGQNEKITHVETEDGRKLFAKNFISNISPAVTLSMVASDTLKGAYPKRISSLEHTISSFSLYIVLKEKTVPYANYNYYHHKTTEVWQMNHYTEANWPLGYGLYFTRDKNHPEYASSVSALTTMRFSDVAPWKDTYNRVGREAQRGEGYERFKQKKMGQFLQAIEKKFPEIKENSTHIYAATPLTNRDYIGMHDGSMYGIQKDFNHPLKTWISPRTKISNLFLTGQNINLHGILGTSLSAILTCTLLLDDKSIVDKIKNA